MSKYQIKWYHRKAGPQGNYSNRLDGRLINVVSSETSSASSTSGGVVDIVVVSTVTNDATRRGIVAGVVVSGFLATDSGRSLVVPDVDTEDRRVDVAVADEEEGAEDWLGQDIENTIKDSLRVWRDDVSTLTESPCNGVQEPEEDGPGTAKSIGLANGRVDG